MEEQNSATYFTKLRAIPRGTERNAEQCSFFANRMLVLLKVSEGAQWQMGHIQCSHPGIFVQCFVDNICIYICIYTFIFPQIQIQIRRTMVDTMQWPPGIFAQWSERLASKTLMFLTTTLTT